MKTKLSPAQKLATLLVTAIALVPMVWSGLLGDPQWLPLPLRHLWTFTHLFPAKPASWRSFHVQIQGADGAWQEVPHGPPFEHETFGRMTRLQLMLLYMTQPVPPSDREAIRQRDQILDKLLRDVSKAHQQTGFEAAPAIERPVRAIRFVGYERPTSLTEPPQAPWDPSLPGPVRQPYAIVVRKLAIDDKVGGP